MPDVKTDLTAHAVAQYCLDNYDDSNVNMSFFAPESVEECVIKYAANTQSESAVKYIYQSCYAYEKSLNLKRRKPVIGEIMEGYRFLGGDPSVEKNWKKLPLYE